MRYPGRALAVVIVALAVAAIDGWFGGRYAARPSGTANTGRDTGGMALPASSTAGSSSFAALADAVTPAVVHVKVESRRRGRGNLPSLFGDELLERFFGGKPDPGPRRGLGSGVVIDAAGLALTNAHVVDGATSIEVVMHDGVARKATLVGADPTTDVALPRLASSAERSAVTPGLTPMRRVMLVDVRDSRIQAITEGFTLARRS